MANPKSKQQPMTGEQQRLSGVQHLFAAERGQRQGLNDAAQRNLGQVAAQPFQTRRPYWSK